MKHDLNKLAAHVRTAHALGMPMRLPAMTIRELGVLTGLLQDRLVTGTPLLH